MRRPLHGFTLAELMVVLVVLGILLAIGIPAFSQLVASARLLNGFSALTTSLASARMAAISHRFPVTVCPTRDGERCRRDLVWEDGWMVFLDRDRKGAPASATAVLQRVDAQRGLVIRSTVGRHYVRYQPSGTSGGSNLTLRLCTGEPAREAGRVVVNIAGRAYSRRVEAALPCP